MHALKIFGIAAGIVVAIVVVCLVGFCRQISKNGWER
jgi:hypothetical protein